MAAAGVQCDQLVKMTACVDVWFGESMLGGCEEILGEFCLFAGGGLPVQDA